MPGFVLRGNFVWPKGRDALSCVPDGFGVCDADGLCRGVFETLPPEYSDWPQIDAGDGLVIPGYTDLHLHAAQYRDLGCGMDLQLIDWLSTLTYPEEARFADVGYARSVYTDFAAELRAGFTTRAVMFASAHTDATLALMDILEASGLITAVGRVGMDRNAPDYIREPSADAALAETERWLSACRGRYTRTEPVITPRFVPSCTPAYLRGLGELAARYHLAVQSHLDEQPDEVAWVRELAPDSIDYADVYDRAGLLGPGTVMAHCIYMTGRETALLRDRGVFVAHCPASNANVRSGIAPIRKYLDMGLRVGLGTDISGGHSLDMADTVRDALAASRLLWCLDEQKPAHLRAEEVFYLATAGGGERFGRVGRFLPDWEFDAVAVDDSAWRGPDDDLPQRLRRMLYLAHSSDVRAKFVKGRRLF